MIYPNQIRQLSIEDGVYGEYFGQFTEIELQGQFGHFDVINNLDFGGQAAIARVFTTPNRRLSLAFLSSSSSSW